MPIEGGKFDAKPFTSKSSAIIVIRDGRRVAAPAISSPFAFACGEGGLLALLECCAKLASEGRLT